jgi:hypothetical protein
VTQLQLQMKFTQNSVKKALNYSFMNGSWVPGTARPIISHVGLCVGMNRAVSLRASEFMPHQQCIMC